MVAFSNIILVKPRENRVYAPEGNIKITAVVVSGSDFVVKLSDTAGDLITGEILSNGANLAMSIFLSNQTRLVFENRSNQLRVGFLCGEEAN